MTLTVAELRAVYSVDEKPLQQSLAGIPGLVNGVRPSAVKLDGDAAGVENASSRAKTALGGVASFAGTASKAVGGFFAVDAIKDFVGGTINAASDLNETVNKSNVIFGQSSSIVNAWAQNSAKSVGLSRAAALDAAAGFGNMFTQLGFAGDEAANLSTQVVGMAADLGSFNNLPTEDVAERISAAFRGEYDSLQTLIPNINAARVEQEAMAATGKTNADQLTAQEKAAAVLAIVHKDGAAAMGDFARTSDGLANSQKILSAQWDDQKAKIGAALLPAMTSLVGFISGTAIPALASFGQWVGDNKTPILIVAGVIGAVLLPALITMAVTSTTTAATAVAAWVLMGVQSMINAARMAAAWVIAMGPVGWVIAAVIGLVALIIANWDTVVSWTQAAWSAVTGAIGAAWEWIKGAVSAGLQFLVSLFLNFTGPGLIIKHWQSIVDFTRSAWSAVTGAVSGAWNAVTGAISSGVGTAVSWVAGMPGKLLGALGDVGSLLLGAGKSVIQGFLDGITGAFGKVKDKLQSLTSLLPDWKGPATRDAMILHNAGQLVMGGFEAGLVSKFGDVQRTLGGFTDQMQGLTVRRPTGAGGSLSPTAGIAAPSTAAGTGGPLVNIEEYYEQPGSSPQANAQALAVEVRTRPWT